jgi:hypothetical protein
MSSHQSHDYFIELCAISTSGDLNAEEWRQLEEHLLFCATCRKIKAQYESVVAVMVPALAPDSSSQYVDESPAHAWSLAEAEASLMARLDGQNNVTDIRPASLSRGNPWTFYAKAAVFLLAFTYIGYRIGIYRRGGATATSTLSTPQSPTDSQRLPDRVASVAPLGIHGDGSEDPKVADLRRQLQMSLLEVNRLREQKSGLEDRLAARETDLNRGSQEVAELAQRLSSAQSDVQNLQDKVKLSASEKVQDGMRLQTLEAQLNTFTNASQEKDKELSRNEQLLEHDRDIRNLIGARDLYIAEIYDVAKTGATQKPFGRVFYTKGKSLVFYAYDLDQQPGVKLASTFQAWGRRGVAQGHDINLGIFYQDDRNKKRWILKSNDPSTLSQIDAVFVTVEPNGESSKPSSKPLLFTYLRLTPNHP